MFIGLSVCQQNYAKTVKLNLLTFTRSLMTYMVITRIFGGGGGNSHTKESYLKKLQVVSLNH